MDNRADLERPVVLDAKIGVCVLQTNKTAVAPDRVAGTPCKSCFAKRSRSARSQSKLRVMTVSAMSLREAVVVRVHIVGNPFNINSPGKTIAKHVCTNVLRVRPRSDPRAQ